MVAVENITLLDIDYEGPVPAVPVIQTDYYLLLSWAVILIAITHTCINYKRFFIQVYNKVTQLMNYDHPHQE